MEGITIPLLENTLAPQHFYHFDYYGLTPLHTAIMSGNYKMAQWLFIQLFHLKRNASGAIFLTLGHLMEQTLLQKMLSRIDTMEDLWVTNKFLETVISVWKRWGVPQADEPYQLEKYFLGEDKTSVSQLVLEIKEHFSKKIENEASQARRKHMEGVLKDLTEENLPHFLRYQIFSDAHITKGKENLRYNDDHVKLKRKNFKINTYDFVHFEKIDHVNQLFFLDEIFSRNPEAKEEMIKKLIVDIKNETGAYKTRTVQGENLLMAAIDLRMTSVVQAYLDNKLTEQFKQSDVRKTHALHKIFSQYLNYFPEPMPDDFLPTCSSWESFLIENLEKFIALHPDQIFVGGGEFDESPAIIAMKSGNSRLIQAVFNTPLKSGKLVKNIEDANVFSSLFECPISSGLGLYCFKESLHVVVDSETGETYLDFVLKNFGFKQISIVQGNGVKNEYKNMLYEFIERGDIVALEKTLAALKHWASYFLTLNRIHLALAIGIHRYQISHLSDEKDQQRYKKIYARLLPIMPEMNSYAESFDCTPFRPVGSKFSFANYDLNSSRHDFFNCMLLYSSTLSFDFYASILKTNPGIKSPRFEEGGSFAAIYMYFSRFASMLFDDEVITKQRSDGETWEIYIEGMAQKLAVLKVEELAKKGEIDSLIDIFYEEIKTVTGRTRHYPEDSRHFQMRLDRYNIMKMFIDHLPVQSQYLKNNTFYKHFRSDSAGGKITLPDEMFLNR